MSPKKWVDATDAIKDNLIPPELTPSQVAYTYANEADMLDRLDHLYDNKVEMA